jgi:magnesium chelatase subunit D
MSDVRQEERTRWIKAVHAAALFAADMVGTVGIALRGHPCPVRDRWLELLRDFLPGSAPIRRVPHHVSHARLIGGLDLVATLQAGRPIAERGILQEADGGVLVLTTAERMPPGMAACIGSVLDSQGVLLQREGLTEQLSARLGVVILDEGIDDERPPFALLDRLAFQVDLDGIGSREATDCPYERADIAEARERLPRVQIGKDIAHAMCEASLILGISSCRASLLALRAARAAAALAGRDGVAPSDAELAASLVLAPRATILPAREQSDEMEERQSPDTDGNSAGQAEHGNSGTEEIAAEDQPVSEVVLAAARAAIPARLLANLRSSSKVSGSPSPGRAGALQSSSRHGRPAGVRRGDPRSGARLNVVETLRAAAPWQPLRRRGSMRTRPSTLSERHIDVRREDFRVTRLKQRSETTTIFAVDASGSSALHRLAEAKGAVELLLADCYVRRDRVALLAFRGRGADLILPPTRSLARVKRCLAGQPGGGGTPLAAAIDAAVALADAVRRRGQSPIFVLLTDGRANVARDGRPGRAQAESDALASARLLRAAGFPALFVDTSSHPHPSAQKLAAEMAARYLPLPYFDAQRLSQAVLAAQEGRLSAR